MRIDKVKHRQISAGELVQPEVNKLTKRGLHQEQIEESVKKLSGKAVEGGNEYDVLLPKVVIESAHLKKGYITFFICPLCQRKVRAVYMLDSRMACRICHRLTYRKQDRRRSTINRLIWDDKLREQFYTSRSPRHVKLALEADWAREAIMDEGYKKGKEIIKKLKT